MKSLSRHFVVYILSFICLTLNIIQPVFACSKIMSWNDDPPYSFIDSAKPEQVQGISVDIVKTILNRFDCDLELIKMPWARALESLKSGRIDILSGAFKTPERQEFAYYSSVADYSPNILFLRSGEEVKWKINSLADIIGSQFKLGVQINVSYSQEFELLKQQALFSQHLLSNSSRVALWRMLSLSRIDGVIADKTTAMIELNHLKLNDKIKPSPIIISNEPAFFAFSKSTNLRNFVDEFDAVYLQLISDGTITEIENSYLD